MKTKIAVNGILGGIVSLGILLSLSQSALSQTNLQFTGVNATDEGNIHIAWSSVSNEVYQIQEADNLQNTNNGTITWNLLYDQYPSQGTNTFWLDTGNYNLVPQIQNPKNMPMRFYRILDEGQDGLDYDEPIVSIISPTNGVAATGELAVTVVAATDQPIISGTELYVDGQEVLPANVTTNYTDGSTNYEEDTYYINTCEWLNQTHTLFATAQSASGLGEAVGSPNVLIGHGVSPFVPILFSNLITEISFSQPQFNPSLGETQLVTADFAAECNWTLQIEDVNSNIVQTATGSGISMAYNWNGDGPGGTNVLPGVYYYYISAETNGEPLPPTGGGFYSGGGGSPPSPDFAMSDISELWAVTPDGEGAIPLALYPPGFDTNGFTIFSASPSEMSALRPSVSSSFSAMDSGGGFSPADSGGSSAASQNAPASPQRPPPAPAVGTAGQFGIAFQDYIPQPFSLAAPANGLGVGGLDVSIQGTTDPLPYGRLETIEDDYFVATMARGAWQPAFNKVDGQLKPSDLRSAAHGGANVFNNGGSFGLLSVHGAYGTSQDFSTGANGAEQVYLAIDGRQNTGSAYVRMSEMSLGSPGVNGLKWMTLYVCNSLRQQNWNSMRSAGWQPFNGNLHLLLGANSTLDTGNIRIFAKMMLGLDGQTRQTIMNAWQNSASYCLHHPTTFAAAGFNDCEQDMLTGTNSYTPTGSIFYQSFTPQ